MLGLDTHLVTLGALDQRILAMTPESYFAKFISRGGLYGFGLS